MTKGILVNRVHLMRRAFAFGSAPIGRAALAGALAIVALAWPVVVNMLSLTLMGIADTYFVGRLGSAQQGAVGFASTFMWSIYCFFLGTMEIVQTYVAQSTGAGSPERISTSARR